MKKYDGFQIRCGCKCVICGSNVELEGYSDASGTHYCYHCDDYVKTAGFCSARTAEKIAKRQERIIAAGADKD